MQHHLWQLPVFVDDRGGLCVGEFKSLPFKPKRIYFLFNSKLTRGGHAHKKEKEVFVCVKGSFTARIHDGKRWKSIKMNKPGQSLFNANMVWHEFKNFSKDAIMLAISSTSYKGTKEYILDFKEFLSLCRKKS